MPIKIQKPSYYIQLLHFLHKFRGGHLHTVEGEPFFAEVFDAGTEVIDRFINAKEAVV